PRDRAAGSRHAGEAGSGPRERNRGSSGSRGHPHTGSLPRRSIPGGVQTRLPRGDCALGQPHHSRCRHARVTWILSGVSGNARVVLRRGGRHRAPSRPGRGGYAPDCADHSEDVARRDADCEGCTIECRAVIGLPIHFRAELEGRVEIWAIPPFRKNAKGWGTEQARDRKNGSLNANGGSMKEPPLNSLILVFLFPDFLVPSFPRSLVPCR